MAETNEIVDTPTVAEGAPVVHQKKQRIFFPNLDGLRFYSYAAVFFFHVWLLYFHRYSIEGVTADIVAFLFKNGELGVNFFFVLSGFLITYLLIEEKKLTGRIHVVNFYIRRILRIWPLFYLVVIFGLIVYPQLKAFLGGEEFQVMQPWTYLVFLNNFDFIHNGAPAIISILWSVAIEEQFYLCWPLILSLVPLRYSKWVFYTIIAGSLIFRSFHIGDERVLMFHTLAVIGDMALGGLLAYKVIFSSGFKRFIEELPGWFIGIVYACTLGLVFFRHEIFYGPQVVVERLCFALLFGTIILEQNFSKHSLWKLSNTPRISKLGIYTYGLYCIHVTAMTITEMGLGYLGVNLKNPSLVLTAAVIAFFLTIALAYLSYHIFEKKFLKLKDRFAFIVKK